MTAHVKSVLGYVITNAKFQDKMYDNMKLSVLDDLWVDIFLSLNFQTRHESVKFEFNGNKPPIGEICGLSVLNVEPPDLFCNLSHDCKPITTKSRKYNSGDKKFIKDEVQCLLSEGIIEPSTPPWRAWAVVTKDDNHKKRLVIDYSQAIKQLDAYRYQIRMTS